jgi:hypothetical protein
VKDRLDKAAQSVQGQTPKPEWLVAPEPVAAPRPMMSAAAGDATPAEVRWYLPTWSERLRLMGWRNVLWIGPALVLFAFFIAPLAAGHGLYAFVEWVPYWKLVMIAVALPITLAFAESRKALQHRTDPFCIHCGYSAIGLPDGHACPECGAIFSHAHSAEYRRDPHWYIERLKHARDLPRADVPFEAGANRVENADGV